MTATNDPADTYVYYTQLPFPPKLLFLVLA